jgi:predicted ATPase
MEQEKHFQIIDNHVVYDFDKTMSYLNRYGKSKFGDKFQLRRNDTLILGKLMSYAIRDRKTCEQHDIDLEKGILLIGKIGCGKTSLMDIFRILHYQEFRYQMISTREIAKEFVMNGYPVLNKYGKKQKIICFDDLGIETSIKHFGNECNTMGEILLSRYDIMKYDGILTHATTNLNADDLEKLYGNRVRSRLREMFNVISFPSDVLDKRK